MGGSNVSDEFQMLVGFKQGCLMSPILFTLYINDLRQHLRGGIYIGENKIKLLLYDDDFLAELQMMIVI